MKIGISAHPGLLLGEELEERGMSPRALSIKLGIPANRLTEIIRGKREITADTSYRLGKFFGQSTDFWYKMQTTHNYAVFMQQNAKQVDKELRAAQKAA